MLAMFRPLSFLVVVAGLVCPTSILAQTPPPGPPFDGSKHPNPIVTFVDTKDFKPISSDQARKESGIELLGITQDEGKRESIEVADGRFVKNMSILGGRTDVTFYPVVRQKFMLSEGGGLILYS